MKNVLKSLNDKLKLGVAKVKSIAAKLKTPETQATIMQRSGIGLLAGSAAALGALIAVPALAIPAGAAALGLMGVGFGLLQESDNKKHSIWMKQNEAVAAPDPVAPAPVPAPAVGHPAPEAPAPVAEVKSSAVEFAKAVEQKEAPVVAAPAAAPEAPKPQATPPQP